MIVYFNSFFLTPKSTMINKIFYEDSKLICIFKFDFFQNPKLTCIFIKYISNFFFLNPKLICIFIKYRYDFFFWENFSLL